MVVASFPLLIALISATASSAAWAVDCRIAVPIILPTATTMSLGIVGVVQGCHPEDSGLCPVPPAPFGPHLNDFVDEATGLSCNAPAATIPVRQASGEIVRVPLRRTNFIVTDGELTSGFNYGQSPNLSPLGIIIKSSVQAKPICMLTADDIKQTFRYHDPATDMALIKKTREILPGTVEFVDANPDKIIEMMRKQLAAHGHSIDELIRLRDSGAAGLVDKYSKAGSWSLAEGPLDFSSYEAITSNKFFIVEGVAYNYRDFGNLLWGISMRILGIDDRLVHGLSEANGGVNTYRQNAGASTPLSAAPVPGLESRTVILGGDSTYDQAAIKTGYSSPIADRLLEEYRRKQSNQSVN